MEKYNHYTQSREMEEKAKLAEEHEDFKLLPISYEELEEECRSDDVLKELFTEMINNCILYTETIIKFQKIAIAMNDTSSKRELMDDFSEIDAIRKVTHNTTIDSINILARNLKDKSKNSKWIGKLSGNRAAYGRFAILITFARILKDPNLNR